MNAKTIEYVCCLFQNNRFEKNKLNQYTKDKTFTKAIRCLLGSDSPKKSNNYSRKKETFDFVFSFIKLKCKPAINWTFRYTFALYTFGQSSEIGQKSVPFNSICMLCMYKYDKWLWKENETDEGDEDEKKDETHTQNGREERKLLWDVYTTQITIKWMPLQNKTFGPYSNAWCDDDG